MRPSCPAKRASPRVSRRAPLAESAGRVIAGTARGIRLAAPPNGAVRPLGDRVKQALFAMLERDIRDRPFLDLFAGSGAGGIEALSRGAAQAVFVERDPAASATIERNLGAAGLIGPRAIVVRGDAIEWLRDRAGRARTAAIGGPFATVLADPPYDQPDLLVATLAAIADAGPGVILAADGSVAAKHARRTSLPARIGLLASVRERQFGETALTFLRWARSDEEAG
jgi:16S rRNA (guanine966-N2)-methyltransferase